MLYFPSKKERPPLQYNKGQLIKLVRCSFCKEDLLLLSTCEALFQPYSLPSPHLLLPCRSDRYRGQPTVHEYMCTIKFRLCRPDKLHNVGLGATVRPTYGEMDMTVPVSEYMSCAIGAHKRMEVRQWHTSG